MSRCAIVRRGWSPKHAQPSVNVVVVGVAASKVAAPTTFERVTPVQHSPIVETHEVTGPKRIPNLEPVVARDVCKDAKRRIRTRNVGGGHVGCAPHRVEGPQRERLVS